MRSFFDNRLNRVKCDTLLGTRWRWNGVFSRMVLLLWDIYQNDDVLTHVQRRKPLTMYTDDHQMYVKAGDHETLGRRMKTHGRKQHCPGQSRKVSVYKHQSQHSCAKSSMVLYLTAFSIYLSTNALHTRCRIVRTIQYGIHTIRFPENQWDLPGLPVFFFFKYENWTVPTF